MWQGSTRWIDPQTRLVIREGSRKVLTAIERRNLKLLLVMLIASGLFLSPPLSASLALGGAISVANFRGLRLIIERAMRGKPILLMALFLKFFALLGLLFFIIKYIDIHKAAFVIGLSTAFLGIAWEGFKGYLGDLGKTF